jgi:flagellar hook-length control protein FliK
MPTRVAELQNAVDAVRATFTMAVRQGQTQARISLSPPSLGAIRISLSQTSDGLVARVVADHPEALRLLMQNSAELRNSLQSSGLHLLRLDIGQGGQSGAQSGASSQTSAEAGAGGSAEEGDDEGAAAPAGTAGVSPGSGSMIDVMA